MMTSAQIIALACQAAKVPGYTTQAGQFLNARLVQLALQQDLDIVRRFFSFTTAIGSTGPYQLPSNYLRARQVYYYLNGISYDLDQKDMTQFNRLYQGPGLSDYPYLYATDVAGSMLPPPGMTTTIPNPNTNVPVPVIYLYPQPVVNLLIEVLYMDTTVEVPNPQSSSVIPWFPDQRTLLHMIIEDLMMLTDDVRAKDLQMKADDQMRSYLRMDNDKEQRAEKVKLDTDCFRTSRRSIRPTKIQGD